MANYGKYVLLKALQTLVELFNALTRKLKTPRAEASIIVRALAGSDHWRKINYTHDTVGKAVLASEKSGSPFLDTLIAETMKENGIRMIATENGKDFAGITGIEVLDPLASGNERQTPPHTR